MRLLGGCIVLMGSLGLAMNYILTLREEWRSARELRDILELISEEIRYGRMSLPECFVQVGMQRRTTLGRCFGELGRKALDRPQESLRELLEEDLREHLRQVLPPEEYHAFFEFAAPEGYQDEQMQRRALNRSRARMEELLEIRGEQLRGKSRVACCLGITGGVFLILFLW